MQIFFQKHAHHNKQQWVSGSFIFFRMHRISDIYFVGGFGTVQWIDVSEYNSSRPDDIVLAGCNHCMRVSSCRLAQSSMCIGCLVPQEVRSPPTCHNNNWHKESVELQPKLPKSLTTSLLATYLLLSLLY